MTSRFRTVISNLVHHKCFWAIVGPYNDEQEKCRTHRKEKADATISHSDVDTGNIVLIVLLG